MTYTTAEGRQQILDALAVAAQETGTALAHVSEAYEHLDERTADRLEEQLFQPLQAAYGRAKRTHVEFAQRHALPERAFGTPPQVAPASGVKELIDRAVDAAAGADEQLIELQDSMLPVEVGDTELRAGIAETRTLLGRVPAGARELTRTLGR